MRSQQFRDGYAHASREAVARLHERAAEMNGSHAQRILRSAADDFGRHFARRRERMAPAPEGERLGRDPCA